MACNEVLIRVPPREVFAVLGDPRVYPRWVVGSGDLRFADPAWPSVGSRLATRVGRGPVGLGATTTVVDAVPERMVKLLVQSPPLPDAGVRIDLRQAGEATRVSLREGPANPLLSLLAGPLVHETIRLRNAISLARLKTIAEG